MRSKMQILLLLFIASLLIVSPTLGDDVFIYPDKGQTKKQQDKDKYECYDWAKQQTGFDPMAQPKGCTSGSRGRRHCRRCGQGGGHRRSRRRFVRRHEKAGPGEV